MSFKSISIYIVSLQQLLFPQFIYRRAGALAFTLSQTVDFCPLPSHSATQRILLSCVCLLIDFWIQRLILGFC